ncbi:MAG TPA: NAD(P)H-binding protein [Rubrobacter sp.]|nr:NAD(P)H-binding protein [Rubrobacter sp.]
MSTQNVLVTGGTGVLGSLVVERLDAAGVGTRVLSRGGRPGTVRGDLLTGEGLEEAVRGVGTIVHCASSPYRKTREVDVGGTRRLLGAAAEAGVSHLVFISIVGVDRASSYPYYRIKLEAEREIEGSAVPHTILRATQFYDLVLTAMRFLDRLPVMPVPAGLPGQPIDPGEVAGRLVDLALSGPAGRVPDVGGPEVGTLADSARRYLGVIGSRKKVVEFPLPGRTARAVREGALTCPENRYGKTRWEEFLRRQLGPEGRGRAEAAAG